MNPHCSEYKSFRFEKPNSIFFELCALYRKIEKKFASFNHLCSNVIEKDYSTPETQAFSSPENMLNIENEVIPNQYESLLLNEFSKKDVNERCQSVFLSDGKKNNATETYNHYSMHKNIIINYWERNMSISSQTKATMQASCISSKFAKQKRNNVDEKEIDCQSGCHIF